MVGYACRRGGVFVFLLWLVAPPIAHGSSRTAAEILREVRVFLQQGNLAEAEKRLGAGLKELPREAGLYDLRGVVAAEKGDYRSSEAAFQKAIALDPLLSGAYLNLGQLYQQRAAVDRDATQKALVTYARLLKVDPASVEANYQSAFLLARRKAFRASLEHLSKLPAAEQQKAQALSVRCADLAGLKRFDEATGVVGQLLNAPDLTEADIISLLPNLELARLDSLQQQLLEGAIRRHVAGFAVLDALGRLCERQGKLDVARATLESAAQTGSHQVETLLELARVAEKQTDYKGALGYLAHARDLDPQNPAIHFFFGMVCVEEGLLEQAYQSLKQAAQKDSENPYYNYALGAVAQQRADPHEAVPYFKKYIALKPGDPRGRLQLGITYFESHQDDLARVELEGAAHFREVGPPAHLFLARIADHRGDYSAALHELQLAHEAKADYADAYAEEGSVFLKQKNYAAAEKALSRAIAIDRDHYAANLNLLMLWQRTRDSRGDEQAKRFEEVKKKRAAEAKLALRSIIVAR